MDIIGLLFKVVFVLGSVLRKLCYRDWRVNSPHNIFAENSAAYYPQYAEIQKTGDASGFSTAVSGILVISNTIRVFFFFLDPFDVTLLVQSVAVVVGQAALLRLCVECNAAKSGRALPKKVFDLSNPLQHWWAWSHFSSFVSAWLVIVTLLCAVTFLGWESPAVAAGVGMLALGLEATMGFPQFAQNASRGSTEGLSTVLILGWVAGDLIKVATYLNTHAPWQFLLCAAVQITCDCSILAQIAYFHTPTGASGKSTSPVLAPIDADGGPLYAPVNRSPSPPLDRLPESPRSYIHTRPSSAHSREEG
jgi:hypothetical protein